MSRFFLFLILHLLVSVSSAAPLSKENIPEPLKPWVNWVLQDEEKYQCPFFYNNFQQKRCGWPGELRLELQATQAQFSSHWQVYKDSWISLPGSQKYWPQNVRVNKQLARVMAHQGKPGIKLAAGSYKITGDFFWDRMPDSLTIPQDTGLFSLTINGKDIFSPTLKNGHVWLKESDIGQKKPKNIENKHDLQVFRKVVDSIPLQLITYLELEVSGNQREIKLSHALLKDFIPVVLNSPLPARLESDGSLLLQVRPGRWHIELRARHPQQINKLSFNVDDASWPLTEIWSFSAQAFLRLVEIKQLKSIDPSQSNVPGEWKGLPAYLLKQGDAMLFKVISRGDPQPEPSQLSLKRTLWLDFDGNAYTVSDTITGKMTSAWRLDVVPGMQLGQVKLNGKNQLITYSSKANKQGIEVRKGNINLVADSRINGSISHINAVGWEQKFKQVQAELNLPPGWRLLTVSGVDNDPNSWISQWTLLDLFLVLIASLAISRLWSVYWGVIALITLSICWHEPQSPHFIWLNILAAIALIRVLPAGKFQNMLKGYRNTCWLVLLVIVIPFMVSQIRIALYPQLERQWQKIAQTTYNRAEPVSSMGQVMDMAESMSSRSASKMRKLASPAFLGAEQNKVKQKIIERLDPDANIQTGPGLPQWQWKKIRLSWNGSVDPQQQVSLWYLSPAVNIVLNFLRVILVVVLSLLMFGLLDKKIKWQFPKFIWVFIIPLLLVPIQDVSASFPEQKILDDLKSRLLEAPDCLPGCAQIPRMSLSINQQQLVIKLQVHTQQLVAVPLPAKFEQWFPNQVKVNGQNSQALIRRKDGSLWIQLNEGIHQVELQGLNPVQNKFSLPLPLKPHSTTIDSKGWHVEGIHEHGRTDNQLIFNRLKAVQLHSQEQQKKLEPSILPAFIKIERTLNLALDWHITTRVVRVFNNDASVAFKFPLLKGESVTSSKVRVKNKQVQINMSSQQHSFQWESTLEKTAQIDLIAADTDLWVEVWRLDVSPIWHMESSGLAVVHHQDRGRWLPEWRPWPGEKLSLLITRPRAVKGSTLTIDKTELQIKPGKRSLESELKFTVRSSKAQQYTVQLPKQVKLQSVMINGLTQAIRQKGTAVSLPIKPGQQSITLIWHKLQEQSILLTSPSIDMGIASVNNHIKILLGRDRWLLFTSGPKFGPAVLFWGVLIVIVLFSIGLGKISLTPLKHWHWFLLLIGISQIPVESALLVVAWLMALGLRAKKQIVKPAYFNAAQIGLGLLTGLSLVLLFVAVQQGLLGSPDMQVVGNQSSAFNLNWYQDRSEGLLPTATVISVPLISYRILMLLWSLWLAVSLLNWLKWAWTCFSTEGLWKKKSVKDKGLIMENEGK